VVGHSVDEELTHGGPALLSGCLWRPHGMVGDMNAWHGWISVAHSRAVAAAGDGSRGTESEPRRAGLATRGAVGQRGVGCVVCVDAHLVSDTCGGEGPYKHCSGKQGWPASAPLAPSPPHPTSHPCHTCLAVPHPKATHPNYPWRTRRSDPLVPFVSHHLRRDGGRPGYCPHVSTVSGRTSLQGGPARNVFKLLGGAERRGRLSDGRTDCPVALLLWLRPSAPDWREQRPDSGANILNGSVCPRCLPPRGGGGGGGGGGNRRHRDVLCRSRAADARRDAGRRGGAHRPPHLHEPPD